MGKPKRRAGRHRENPVTLPAWDMGATGPANRIGLVVEDAPTIDPETGEARNPNGVKRVRRVDVLETLHKRGKISLPGYTVAVMLRGAFEATQQSPGWPDNDRVQASPKPDHAVTIQVDRLSRYSRIARHIPREDRDIIGWCVLHGGWPQSMPDAAGHRPYSTPGDDRGYERLRGALDRLAKRMGG